MPLGGFDDPDAWDLFAEQEQEQVQSEDPIAESPSPAPPDAPAAQGWVGTSNESLSPVTSVTSPWAQAEAAMVQQPTVALPFYPEPASGGEQQMKRPRLQAESSARVTCIACPSHGSAASSEVAQSGSAAIQVKSEERRFG